MHYISTRGHPDRKRFCDILLEGLAPDGGLYLPESYPQVSAAELRSLRGLPYAELAFRLLSKFIDDIPSGDLQAICYKTYTPAVFRTPAITPLKDLEPGLRLVALSNGPTLAFKDMAMQLLGNLFEYQLAKTGGHLNILGATSGDTGSAAEYAMRGKAGVRVFMLSPKGKMSAFQTAQMFSLQDANIHNITVAGVFDDCQDIVKAVSNDLAFKAAQRIGTVNSINWARLLAQVVYYFASYFYATEGDGNSDDEQEGAQVSFCVPSGNFGNICAGHVARMMGLPIKKLVLATNENNVLEEFFRTGTYRVRASEQTFHTSSPSMDISKASNFERFVFDLVGRDAVLTKSLFKDAVEQQGLFSLNNPLWLSELKTRYGFQSGASSHAERLSTISNCYFEHGVMIDPHTADGVKVAREHVETGVPMLVLETALPAKFAETIVQALGRQPDRPAGLENIEALPQRATELPTNTQAIKDFIVSQVSTPA